jgi:hypothetical protein
LCIVPEAGFHWARSKGGRVKEQTVGGVTWTRHKADNGVFFYKNEGTCEKT